MKRFIFTLLTLLAVSASVFAQGSGGSIIGTITDPSGAVVPGATVVVKDAQTGRERTVTATEDGTFKVSQLEFGTYTVTITAQGFQTFVANEVKVDTGRDVPLNVSLQVGQVGETVVVTAGAEIMNQSDATLSNTISQRDVRELPINGRNPLALLNLLPGVNPTSSSINGQRSTVTNYTRDGLNVQDNFIRLGGFVQDRPTVDDTGEFTVITQNAGAEFGGSQIVQLVTPRGGQDFHGALYEFNRNSKFGANRFFNNLNNIPKPFLNRNQFGGTISGPTVLPRFGEGGASVIRGKAFFFANYEGYRQAQQNSANGTILLPQARTGGFTYTATCTAATCPAGITPGQQLTINVLNGTGLNLAGANGTAFNNAGGAIGIDPAVQARILSRIPTAANGNSTGINFTQVLNFNIASPVTRDAVTGRFDLQFNDRNAMNFVYKRTTEDNARTDLAYGFNTSPYVFQGATTTLYALAYNMNPTPSFSNEIRGGYQRSTPFFNEGGVPTDFVFNNAQTQAANTLAGIITNPEGSFRSQGRNTDYWNLQDNATYSWENHSFRFGGQVQAYKIVALNFAATTPLYNFSTTANPNTPGLVAGMFPGGINATDLGRVNSLRYLLGGIIGGASVQANLQDLNTGFQPGAESIRDLRFENWSGYFQDQWRVSPRLTLNLGVRYELYTPLRNPQFIYLESVVANGQSATEAALNPNGTYNIVGGNSGERGNFSKTDKNNFGPALSFAYSPDFGGFLGSLMPGGGRTVLRGGYRISYNNNEYVRTPDNAYVQLVGLGSQVVNATQGGSAQLRAVITPRPDAPSFAAVPGNFPTPPLPVLPITYAANNALAARQGLVWVFDPDIQIPLVHEYNFGVQREIGWDSAIEIRYVGSFSNSLWRSVDSNQVDIRNNAFLADYVRARENCRLQGATLPGSGDPLLRCTSAAFNPAIAGSQQLSVFPNLATLSGSAGGIGTTAAAGNATIISQIQQGIPADLAVTYVINGLTGTVPFLANRNAFVANVTSNGGLFRYNSLQAEIRRRFTDGFSFQLNYTFQKILTDSTQDTQQSVDPYLDNLNTRLNYARPDYDRTHTVNGNMNLELPFGRGRKWLSDGGLASKIFGGFQITSIVNISSGQPTSVRDPRGTLNRAGRSGLQGATSSLTTSQIKELVGVYRTPNGIFYINPSVLQATASNGVVTQTVDLNQPLPAGFTITAIRGASPIGTAPFPGQVFFLNPPGSTGNLPMNFINGPMYFNWNAGVFRNFKMGETKNLQLRMEIFNVTNRANMNIGESSNIFNIGSTSFGRITGTFDPRIVQFGARFDF